MKKKVTCHGCEGKGWNDFIKAMLLIKKGLDSSKLDLNKVQVVKSIEDCWKNDKKETNNAKV